MRKYTQAERQVSDALMTLWREADEREDWEVGEVVKTALDALDMPWVQMRDDMIAAEQSCPQCGTDDHSWSSHPL